MTAAAITSNLHAAVRGQDLSLMPPSDEKVRRWYVIFGFRRSADSTRDYPRAAIVGILAYYKIPP